jgi:hypothetical protein
LLPIDLEIAKEGGLFSIAGHGSLILKIRIQYEITPGFQLLTKSSIHHHEWIKPPIIDVGVLDIPVEKVVDMMFKHYDSVICGSIDKVIKDKIDIRSQVENALTILKETLLANAYYGLKLYVNPYEVLFEPISDNETEILLSGGIKLDAIVSDHNPNKVTELLFTWAENILDDNTNSVNLAIKEEIISNILCDYLNKMEYGGETLQTKSCKVDFTSQQYMKLSIKIDKPIAGTIHITSIPIYNASTETLNVKNLDIDVNPENFIYKLTAPLLSKFLASEVKNNLPVKVDKILNTYASDFNNKNVNFSGVAITTSFSKLIMKELIFNDSGVSGILQIEDLCLKVLY